jgi:hypothetical protein
MVMNGEVCFLKKKLKKWGTGVYSLHPAESACDSGDAAGMAGIGLGWRSF